MAGRSPWSRDDTGLTSGSPLPSRVDVVVVGAGITGLAAARSLARAGTDVAVLERSHVGAGSTGHGLGVLTADYPGGPHHIMRRIGSGRATALWVAAAQAVEESRTLADALPAVIETVAENSTREQTLERDALWLRERGLEAIVTHSRGVLRTAGAVVDPVDLARGLAEAIQKDGGVLCEAVTVTSVSRHTGGFQILSTAGKISADEVIIAAGPRPLHSGVPRPDPAIRPVDRYGVSLLLDAAAAMPVADVLTGGGVTLRKLSPERVLASAHRGIRSGLSPERASNIVRAMAAALLGTDAVEIQHAWSAPVGLTSDGTPHAWRSDGMWFGGGYNGDAPAAALALGTQLGELLAGIRTQTIFGGIPPAPLRMRRPGTGLASMLARRRGF